MQPVDVYSEWIDACDSLAKEQASREDRNASPPPAAASQRFRLPAVGGGGGNTSRFGDLAPGETVTAEDEGFLDDEDDVEGEGEFIDV